MQALLHDAQQHAAASQDLQRRQRLELEQALQACCTAGSPATEQLGPWTSRLLAMLSLGQGLLRTQLVAISQGAPGLVSAKCCSDNLSMEAWMHA